jgi:fructokinase
VNEGASCSSEARIDIWDSWLKGKKLITRYTIGARMRIGIDLGGTKIEGIAIGPDGRERLRRRIPSPRGDYAKTLAAVTGLVRDLEREIGERGTVGVGIPGTISPATGLVKNANSTWLIGRPLGADLPQLLDRPVRLANDANCFALSEATDGAAAGVPVVFGVIVGTGCGGGVVVNGRVLTGANAIAGEWGHNPLPAPRGDEGPGPPCYCGRCGCIEQFLSGPALARDYREAGGADLTAAEIANLAAAGDSPAKAAVERYAERMARALGSIINVIDPDVIVLGGGLSNIEPLYERVPQLWAPYVFSDRVATRLVRAMHGDSSGVRGAAWLWNEG